MGFFFFWNTTFYFLKCHKSSIYLNLFTFFSAICSLWTPQVLSILLLGTTPFCVFFLLFLRFHANASKHLPRPPHFILDAGNRHLHVFPGILPTLVLCGFNMVKEIWTRMSWSHSLHPRLITCVPPPQDSACGGISHSSWSPVFSSIYPSRC